MGIDTQRMFALGWAIGSALRGCGGRAARHVLLRLSRTSGATFALLAYVTVALGGFGNVPATLLAGVLVGLVEAFGGLLLAPGAQVLRRLPLYLGVVLWRPQGLFGRF